MVLQINATGLAATAADTLFAAAAPGWTSACALDPERFQTVTLQRASTKAQASAKPMRPSPRLEISLMQRPGIRALQREPSGFDSHLATTSHGAKTHDP